MSVLMFWYNSKLVQLSQPCLVTVECGAGLSHDWVTGEQLNSTISPKLLSLAEFVTSQFSTQISAAALH